MSNEKMNEKTSPNAGATAAKTPRTLSEGDISLTRSRLAGSVSHVGGAKPSPAAGKLAGKPSEIGDPDAH